MHKKATIFIMAVLFAGAVIAQTLQVSPEKLSATGTRLTGASSDSISVGNSYTNTGSTSYYTVAVSSDDTNWLAVSASSGSATNLEYDTITVSYTTANLTAGNLYTGTITVQQTNGTVQTKTIAVNLKIDDDSNLGTAIGEGSLANTASGIAIGDRTGRAIAIGAETTQIGGGSNTTAGTFKVRAYELLDSSGVIPAARRGGTLASSTNYWVTAISAGATPTNPVYTYRQVIVINGQLTSIGAATLSTNTVP